MAIGQDLAWHLHHDLPARVLVGLPGDTVNILSDAALRDECQRLHAENDRLQGVDATCAAMRAALGLLEVILEPRDRDGCPHCHVGEGEPCNEDCELTILGYALRNDAGRAFLDTVSRHVEDNVRLRAENDSAARILNRVVSSAAVRSLRTQDRIRRLRRRVARDIGYLRMMQAQVQMVSDLNRALVAERREVIAPPAPPAPAHVWEFSASERAHDGAKPRCKNCGRRAYPGGIEEPCRPAPAHKCKPIGMCCQVCGREVGTP